MCYFINAEIFARLIRPLLGVNGWMYGLYIHQSYYYLIIESSNQSKCVFKVQELQTEIESIYIQLSPEFIQGFRAIGLKQLTGDIKFLPQTSSPLAKVYYPDSVFIGEYTYSFLSFEEPFISEDTFALAPLVSFLADIYTSIRFCVQLQNSLIGLDTSSTRCYYYTLQQELPDYSLSLWDTKFFFSCLGKLKLSEVLKGSGRNYETSTELKLNTRQKIPVTIFYLELGSMELDLPRKCLDLYVNILKSGRSLKISQEGIEKTLKKLEETDKKDLDLVQLTRKYRLSYVDYLRIFQDVSLSEVRLFLWKNKLLLEDGSLSKVVTCYHKPETFTPDELETDR